MLIDWFTVAAQAFNFLILVWLLKRFLYAPVLNAIDAREKRIESKLADAETKQTKADATIAEYARKQADFETERIAQFKQLGVDVAVERQRLIRIARNEADDLRSKQQEQLQNEYRRLTDEISRKISNETFAIAKKILLDLADESLEERMAVVFIQRLGKLDINLKQQLSCAAKVVVRSAFELSVRPKIEEAINKLTSASIDFEVVPDLINGIVLIAHGHKITWCVANYLSTLENEVSNLLKIQPVNQPK